MNTKLITLCAVVAALSACTTPKDSLPFDTALDRDSVDGSGLALRVASDGTYTATTQAGHTFNGDWELRDGQWCESLVRRNGEFSETCYDYNVQAESVTFTEAGEDPRVFVFQ